MNCGTILLMQLSIPFFYHENALRNVSLACGHQAGKNCVMELETCPDYIYFATKPQSSHELFNWWVWLRGSSWIHLDFWTEDFDLMCLVRCLSFLSNLRGSTLIPILWMWQKATSPQTSVDWMNSSWQAWSREQLVSADQQVTSPANWFLPWLVQPGRQWQFYPSLGMCVWWKSPFPLWV